MRHVALLGLAALSVAAPPARPAAAQGLLHKHRHVAGPGMGPMRPLPAQASPVAATGDVSSTDGATVTAIAGVPPNPSPAGAVGGVSGVMPVCIAPPAPIDAAPMPLPSIDGGPSSVCPIDPSGGGAFLPPPMFIGGRPDASGPPMSGGAGGFGTVSTGGPHSGRGPLMFGHTRGDASLGPATALSANAFGQATAAAATAAPPGRNVAAGLPGRAVGVRPGPLDVPGRRHMAPIGTAVPGSTTAASADVQPDAGVIQAAGIGQKHEGATRGLGGAGTPAAGPTSSAAATVPRWRDRLRFAWPTTK